MAVYLLRHVGHQNTRGYDGNVLHLDDGGVHVDEQDGDDVKLLGVYSSRAKAEARIASARRLPGFADEPECFVIDEYAVDQDEWTEGFKRVLP